LTTNYRVSHAAQLYSFSTAFTQQAGIESLTTQYADNTAIDFYYCAYCWANMVEVKTYLGGGGHGGIDIENSFRDQLEEVYVHQAAYPVPGGGGYNISLAWFSSEILVENSISMIANKVDVAEGCGAGSVFAYNYFDDGFIGGDGSWVETGIGGSHHIGSHHMLFEGNLAFDADNDGTHGSVNHHTYFRNWFTGFRAPFTDYTSGNQAVNDLTNQPGGNGPLRALSNMVWGYNMAYVGNVLGTSGDMTGWTYSDPTANTRAVSDQPVSYPQALK